ncbi:MAG: dCTP deaminase [Nitrospirae bacterium]|nr:dCTP deaminase [Nitrospirota bacterium]
MVKNDRWIREMAAKGMIEPFNNEQMRKGVISFGVSAYGYDMRIFDEFKIPRPAEGRVIDPKNFDDSNFIDLKSDICEIPANSYVICRSFEYFRIPREVLVLCFGKSTYARSGVIVNITPLEPEWEGFVTISVSNTSPFPVRLYANEGIAQIVFIESSEVCETSYADKKGKYQAQQGIVLPKI